MQHILTYRFLNLTKLNFDYIIQKRNKSYSFAIKTQPP